FNYPGKGIAAIPKESACMLLVALRSEKNPLTFEKVGDEDQKRLILSEIPVILGAPPLYASVDSHGRRLFADGTMDLLGLKRMARDSRRPEVMVLLPCPPMSLHTRSSKRRAGDDATTPDPSPVKTHKKQRTSASSTKSFDSSEHSEQWPDDPVMPGKDLRHVEKCAIVKQKVINNSASPHPIHEDISAMHKDPETASPVQQLSGISQSGREPESAEVSEPDLVNLQRAMVIHLSGMDTRDSALRPQDLVIINNATHLCVRAQHSQGTSKAQ
ncbi:hypothetical protein DXG01_009086, partial [Tephrocybe rancida]